MRGTVRDPSDESKIAPIRDALGQDLFSQVEIMAADLMDESSI